MLSHRRILLTTCARSRNVTHIGGGVADDDDRGDASARVMEAALRAMFENASAYPDQRTFDEQLGRLQRLAAAAARAAKAPPTPVRGKLAPPSSARGIAAVRAAKSASDERTRLAEQLLHSAVTDVAIPGYWDTLERDVKLWASELSVQPFWTEARDSIDRWDAAYGTLTKVGARLFPQDKKWPWFVGKKRPRLREKVLLEVANGNLPTLFPPGEPAVPRLKDLIRVRLETNYLDGVEFLRDQLNGHLENAGFTVNVSTQARADDGYYACHLTFPFRRRFTFGSSNDAPVEVGCEIQIATELATTIWDRSHGAYEIVRTDDGTDTSWQWNATDIRFLKSQLAHMIHLADGIVVQIRNAVADAKKKGTGQ